jgi:hypothetical protein
MMSGDLKVTSNVKELRKALGLKKGGWKIHKDEVFAKEDLAFCFPPQQNYTMDTITQMYPVYRYLANLFRDTIMSKSGDLTKVRGYMTNLMFYTKPENQRPIDVVSFIYEEIYTGVMTRRVLAYSAHLQLFIRHAL